MHLNAAKRILRYIKGTMNYGLIYSKYSGNIVMTGFSDSDLAGGMVFYLNESVITLVSQKKKCVTISWKKKEKR